jgi:hypothetical protein
LVQLLFAFISVPGSPLGRRTGSIQAAVARLDFEPTVRITLHSVSGNNNVAMAGLFDQNFNSMGA